MEISAGRRPPFPVACKSSLVHFLLSSTLFRHYSSPRTISNPDRRRLPSLFLLFMLKFIGSSASPVPLGGEKRTAKKEVGKIEGQYAGRRYLCRSFLQFNRDTLRRK